jgi:uncharacterized membrane protein YfcA
LDSNTLGLVGGIAGGVLGVMGGIVGTYFSIKNTNGPKERAFAIRAAILCWFGVSAFLACLFLLPMNWRLLLWVVYLPCLLWFGRWANQRQAGARVEDMTQADLPGHRAGGL